MGRITHQNGFTYLGVMVLLTTYGIALMGATTYYRTLIKREKEQELLYIGNTIRAALQTYYDKTPSGRQKEYPRKLEDLLKDPRYPDKRKYLRKIYDDPMGEHDGWGLVYGKNRRIRGVYSKSKAKPLKTGNFLNENESFQDAKYYSQWKFVVKVGKK